MDIDVLCLKYLALSLMSFTGFMSTWTEWIFFSWGQDKVTHLLLWRARNKKTRGYFRRNQETWALVLSMSYWETVN